MIGRIQGRLLEKTPPFILIDCNGVGYEIEVPMTTFYELPDIGNEITLLTHFIVREDAQLLFGFISDKERKTFKQLIKVNGIGAKVALSILSGISFNELIKAVVDQNADLLCTIPGIGKKTADRLTLELKDKFKADEMQVNSDDNSIQMTDIQNALLALGYSHKDVSSVTRELSEDVSVNDGIRQSLRLLSRN
jgi:holliday junction DNA helicase RuvA|tara:strand:- start:874 stop:1452 length:579 start_codon:yes stop_codon:yes gene_type:complete